ncbi:MAG: biotin--[acetyl-CoA-carboxylase] ligase, partial [Acidimicrobiia bacterium]
MATPYSLKLYDEVTSTQDVAAADFGGEPLLVVAARQAEGRGRSHRRWQQAPRAVAASLAFVPDWPSRSWPLIPLVAGLAAGETLGEGVRLKWPNDLLWGEAGKVGGVLVEGTSARLVVGLGVNLWWPEPPEGIRGLRDDDPGPERGRVLAEAWARNLLHRLARGPLDWDR